MYSLEWLKEPPIRNTAAKNTVTDLLLEAIFSSELFAVQPQLSGMTWYKLNAVNWTNRDIILGVKLICIALGVYDHQNLVNQSWINVAFKKGSGIQEWPYYSNH